MPAHITHDAHCEFAFPPTQPTFGLAGRAGVAAPSGEGRGAFLRSALHGASSACAIISRLGPIVRRPHVGNGRFPIQSDFGAFGTGAAALKRELIFPGLVGGRAGISLGTCRLLHDSTLRSCRTRRVAPGKLEWHGMAQALAASKSGDAVRSLRRTAFLAHVAAIGCARAGVCGFCCCPLSCARCLLHGVCYVLYVTCFLLHFVS